MLLVGALIAFAQAGGGTVTAASDCAVMGVVADGEGAAVGGAAISILPGERTATADSGGRFEISELSPGQYDLLVVAPGFAVGGGGIEVPAACESGVEVVLRPALGEELVVTATGTRQRLLDVPVHMQVVKREQIERSASRTLADAVEWSPGLRVESNCQNCNFSQIRMLGLDGAYSQILIDGQPTFSSLAMVYGIEQIPARLIDGIEVVKGGGAASYGGGAIAGVINLIPHEPAATGGVVEMRYADTGGGSGTSLNGVVDWASASRKTALTAYGQVDEVDPVDVDGDGFTEVTRRELGAWGLRMGHYALEDRAKLALDLSGVSEDRRGGELAGIDLRPDETSLAEEILTDRLGGSLSWLHTLTPRLDYRLAASFSSTQRESYYGAGFDPNAYGSTDNPLWILDSQLNHYREKNTFTFGAQYQLDEIEDIQLGYSRVIEQTYRSAGIYLQDDRELGSRYTLLYGARLDGHSEIDGTIISPRMAFMWTPRTDLTLRTSVSRGFRPPVTFDEDLHIVLVGGGAAQVVHNSPELKEETSTSAALSLEWRPTVGRKGLALLEVNAFDTRIEDLFNNQEADDPATPEIEFIKTNHGAARVYGVELAGSLSWGGTLTADFGFVRQKARFAEPEPDFGSREFFRTPESYGSATLTWRVPKVADLFLGALYTGSMLAPHYAGYIEEDRLEVTPSFLTFDLNLSRRFALGGGRDGVTLTVGVKNLTNEFQPDLDQGPERDSAYVYGPRFPRRTFVGVKYDF